MLRSVAVLLALLILPSFVSAQEPVAPQQGLHEVVKGETLWALAERYLDNPFLWPVIYEANTDRIQDPHWIYPHQMLIIPGLEGAPAQAPAQVQDVEVLGAREEPVPMEPPPPVAQGVCPGDSDRTIFYDGTQTDRGCAIEAPAPEDRTTFYVDPASLTANISGSDKPEGYAVPRGVVYAAPWLEEFEAPIHAVGTVTGFADVDMAVEKRDLVQAHERLVIQVEDGVELRVGDLLQSFDVARAEEDFGQVLQPTAVLTVTSVEEAGVMARVSAGFGLFRIGQKVRMAPDFDLVLGVEAREVESNLSAPVRGFELDREIYGLGSIAFLEVGEAEGISIGDEFMGYLNPGQGWSGSEAVRLQAVLVQGQMTSARVLGIREPILEPGVQLHLVKKMY